MYRPGTNKKVVFKPLTSCIGWLKFSVFGGINHPAHPLYEVTQHDYAGENLEFIVLDKELFDQEKDIRRAFPQQLIEEKETVIGCPDCADGGGLFIQYAKNGKVHSWRIDQNKGNVPSYLHAFMDQVNAKIELLDQ